MHKSHHYDNATLGDIVRLGDTPLLLFNTGRFAELFHHFAQFGRVYYPVKSNDHVDVLREVARLGGCFDVDGISHIRQLLSLGVSPDRIQFGIPVRKQQDVEEALDLEIRRFVVDSTSEYRKISRFGMKVGFLVRIAISDVLHFSDASFGKWGMPLTDVARMRELIQQDGNEFLGISFYIPQELYTPISFSNLLARITQVFEGDTFRVLDIGGGLDNSYSDDFRKDLDTAKKSLKISDIVLEPGRNLLDPCIDLVVSVVGVCKRGDQRWAYIDAGIYSGLLDAVIKKRTFEISTLSETKQSAEYHYFVAGPTSDSLDFLGEYSFETELNTDDRLIMKNCGAYTYALRTRFGGIDGLRLQAVGKRGQYEL